MTERDELRDLWVSQPLQDWKGGKVPRFALLEDEITDISSPPLSKWNKLAFVFWCVYGLRQVVREWPAGAGELERAGTVVLIISALATAAFVLLQRDRSRAPRPDESVADYRAAYLNEFERQYGVERHAIILLFTGVFAGMALKGAGSMLARGFDPMGVIAPAAAMAAALVVFSIRRAYWRSGVKRLRHDLEDVQ